jgi:hypothetical protein
VRKETKDKSNKKDAIGKKETTQRRLEKATHTNKRKANQHETRRYKNGTPKK